jgi:hypothetical protein
VVDGADLLQFVRDQLIALVEKKDAKLFPVGEGLCRAAIVEPLTRTTVLAAF